jgi:hypothetical protein
MQLAREVAAEEEVAHKPTTNRIVLTLLRICALKGRRETSL